MSHRAIKSESSRLSSINRDFQSKCNMMETCELGKMNSDSERSLCKLSEDLASPRKERMCDELVN